MRPISALWLDILDLPDYHAITGSSERFNIHDGGIASPEGRAYIGEWKRDACSIQGIQSAQTEQPEQKAPDASLERDLLGVVRSKQ